MLETNVDEVHHDVGPAFRFDNLSNKSVKRRPRLLDPTALEYLVVGIAGRAGLIGQPRRLDAACLVEILPVQLLEARLATVNPAFS